MFRQQCLRYICPIFVGGVDSQKRLVILKDENYYLKSHTYIAEVLKSYKKRPWINKHLALHEALSKQCKQVDFSGENEQELEQLEDLFFSLKDERKILLMEGVNAPRMGKKLQAVKILLKGLVPRLLGNHNYIPGSLGSVRKEQKNQRFRDYPPDFRRF